MPEFFSFFIVLLASVFFAALFRRLHLPFVVALIVGGMIIGPYGFNVIEINETIDFLGKIGLIFLMFIAGLETKLSSFVVDKKHIAIISSVSSILSFMAGYLIAMYFGYDFISTMLLATVFLASSIAVSVPSIESNNLIATHIGKGIISVTIIADVTSLLIFSFILQSVNPTTSIPLPLFYVLLIVTLIVLRILIPKIKQFFYAIRKKGRDLFGFEIRLILMILLGVVVIFDILGLHSIIAGFFTGLVLSESIHSQSVIDKIHAISYGFFIPVFFIIVGANTNIALLTSASNTLIITIVIVIISIAIKTLGGYIGATISGFDKKRSMLFGVALIPKLSTTLAIAFTGFELGLLDESIVIAMVVLSISTTFIGPILISKLAKKLPPRENPRIHATNPT